MLGMRKPIAYLILYNKMYFGVLKPQLAKRLGKTRVNAVRG